jgi:hypothetical protein
MEHSDASEDRKRSGSDSFEERKESPVHSSHTSGPQPIHAAPAPAVHLHDTDERFGCNICLDPVQDPVVTLCGHLYW